MYRRAIAVRGIVQGVGFRPFVFHLASECGLGGFVKNQLGDVLIEVEGEQDALDRFLADLVRRRPPLARIEEVTWEACPPRGESAFHIEPSDSRRPGAVLIGADIATCAACLAELFDPADRRYRYPFLNCTDCGPRLTIIRAAPYDRPRTTMAGFVLCPACRAEYEDPTDRRFHAQPTACPTCGPRLQLLDAAGGPVPEDDPVRYTVAAFLAGRIAAVKGLGGYHLACDARNEAVVRELRRRKHRDEKPFALMVADLDAARQVAEVSDAEAELLSSPRRPIVLVKKRPGADVAEGVAPGNPCLGLILPYTPLHHLLLREAGGVPLVMTSGNRSDEPIAFEDGDAWARLAGIADFFLTHDRPIHLRCDDSVTRVVAGFSQGVALGCTPLPLQGKSPSPRPEGAKECSPGQRPGRTRVVAGEELPLRRSRGYAPQPVRLPLACPLPTLAVGGQLKNTFALGRGRHALLSHHLGDLDHYEAYRAFVEAVGHYERLFGITPALVVHDLHPDYASTRYALERPGVERLAVQHHHAHLASCLAEHGLTGPAIGVSFDGTGYGTDGAVWGGEFLVGDCRTFRRAAHLRYVAMPGGEQAIREPWRMALAHLVDAGEGPGVLEGSIPPTALRTVGQMLARRVNAPLTSSAGRLFDAVAALAGVRQRVSYEGQAAVELEGLATPEAPAGSYPFSVCEGPAREMLPSVVDTRPLIAAVVRDVTRGVPAGLIARRFHSTLVEMIVHVCGSIRQETGLSAVALSGGGFLNALLTEEAGARLRAEGFAVYRHREVPPGDGGLSLGQLAVAAARMGDADVSGDTR
jgi:hydrogenase maturation protein HypF